MKQAITEWVSRWYIGPLLSAVIIALACLHYHSGWLAFIGLIPLIDYLYQQKNNSRKTVLGVWIFGLVMYGIILAWILTANLENWSDISSLYKNSVRSYVWLTTTLTLSLTHLVAGLAICYLKPFKNMWRLLLLVPSIWIISEFTGSWLFSVVMWAPGSGIEAVYAYGHLEFPAAATPFAYLSRIFGTYGLAFAAVLANVVIWYSVRSKTWKPVTLTTVGLITLSLLGFIIKPTPLQPIQAAAQQKASIGLTGPAGLRASMHNAPRSSQTKTDLLVLPEYGSIFGRDNQKVTEMLQNYLHNKDPLIVYGDSDRVDDTHVSNTVVSSTVTGKPIGSQQKTFLIPDGEYLPVYMRASIAFLGLNDYIKDYTETKRGESDYQPHVHKGVRYGTLFCSAAIAPSFYQQASHQGAEVLTNSGSLAFSSSSLVHGHMKQALRLNTVANAKPLVASTRGGHAYIINHDGRFIAQTRDITDTMLHGSIQPTKGKTVYSQFGEYLLILAPLAVIAKVWTDNRKKKQH